MPFGEMGALEEALVLVGEGGVRVCNQSWIC